MNTFAVNVLLITGSGIAVLFEQYVISLVLLGLTLLFQVAINARNKPLIVPLIVPANQIKILGYPLKEISSTKVQRKGETKIAINKPFIIPTNQIKILGYPLKEISSTEVQWEGETKGNCKGEKKEKLRFDV